MNQGKLFAFFLVVASLILAAFIIKDEIGPAILERLPANSQDSDYADLEDLIRQKLQGFLLENELSLEQRIGQMFVIGINGTIITEETAALIRNFYPGGVLLLSNNIENPEQLKTLVNDLQAVSLEASGLPLFIMADQEGGIVSRVGFLETKIAQSRIKDADTAFQIGSGRGQELKELGINVNLAPVLDTAESSDFLFHRTFKKSLEQSGELAKAIIEGQNQAGILTVIKHFPGYGKIDFNPEEILAIKQEMPPTSQFQGAGLADPAMVMTANVVYAPLDKELPFTFSTTSIQLLKSELGEKITIISDDLSQNSLLDNFSLQDVIILPVEAGVDILMFSGWRGSIQAAVPILLNAVRDGRITEDRINQSVLKILGLKLQISS